MGAQAYQLKASIRGISPPVWRRVVVDGDSTLGHLHRVLQAAFGWWDYHLHEFEVDGVRYGIDDGELDPPPEDEHAARLRDVLAAGSRACYSYDFGDNWMHDVVVEKVVDGDPGMRLPACTGGARACPPEDCGGPSGYEEFLAAVTNPAHPKHAATLTWAGGEFDPEDFDPEDFDPADADYRPDPGSETVDAFATWLRSERAVTDDVLSERIADVELALDWKRDYGDGELTTWRVEDVEEFLLGWCPGKLSASLEECRSIPSSLAEFVTFLDQGGFLAPGSQPAAQVRNTAVALSEEFLDAMSNPANFGLAKSLFGAASAEGLDVTDPEALERWMDDFNSRPFEERAAILPDSAFSGPPPPRAGKRRLPPVALPTGEAVAASKAAAPILATFAQLAEFVGEGRKLTQKGNLTLADARVLVEKLGTGDAFDPQIGDQVFKTRSAAELPGLRLAFRWAKAAGAVRMQHGKVLATKRGLAVGADPAASFDRAVDALVKLGPLSAQRDPDAWLAWPDVDKLLDEVAVHLLAVPYATAAAIPIDDLAATATDVVFTHFEFPNLTSTEMVERRINQDVADIVKALSLAGVAVVEDGEVALTPAGMVTVRRLLEDAGFEAPAAGRLAEGSATELVQALDEAGLPETVAEFRAWLARREPSEAARDLAAAAVELDDPALRAFAVGLLSEVGHEVAEPEVRKLLTEPDVRGFASCWLVDAGFEDPSSLYDPDDPHTFVDVLAHRLAAGGPDALIETLALAGADDAQAALLAQLWRSPSQATVTVLTTIGDSHPTKAVAKAGRKGAFQRRSRDGG